MSADVRLMVAVMAYGPRNPVPVPVENDPGSAAAITEGVLGLAPVDVVQAADHAANDYWMSLPDDLVAEHTVGRMLYAQDESVGIITAALPQEV